MRKSFFLFTVLFASTLLFSCDREKRQRDIENFVDPTSEEFVPFKRNSNVVSSGLGYDSTMFIYGDATKHEYVEYAPVKYYISGDTLYTDVPFRNLSAYYVDTESGLPVNIKCIVYDWKNKPQKNGWYWLYIDNDVIREHSEGTELAGLQLVGYEGPMREEKVSPRKRAILWNASMYNGYDIIFDSIPEEASKIIDIINRK